MTDITITRTKDEPGATTLSVEAPAARVQQAEKKAMSMYAKRVRIPGFRKGKVPLNIVKQRFGDAIKEAVVQELVQESWKLAVDQESLEPIGEPHVHELKLEDGAPLTFEFQVEVKPDIELTRLGGFTLERKQTHIGDDAVDDQLDELRRKKALWIPVEGQKAGHGQMVRVTISTGKDGEEEKGQPYDLVIGQDQALPEIEEKIMELLPGEVAETKITFPAEGDDPSQPGRTIDARIALHEVKQQQLPELDDAFAAEIGEFTTVEELRTAVREDLDAHAKREADADVRRQLVEQLTTANNVPAPRPLVDRLLKAYQQAYQVPDDQVERFTSEFGPIAEAQVKRDLAVDLITRQHELAATEDDVDARVEEMAKARNMEPGKLFATLQKEKRIKELERSITEEKVFTFLLDQSTVTES